MSSQMNNTEFFNNHSAEALKLIAESTINKCEVVIRNTAEDTFSDWERSVWVYPYADDEPYEYNPCATTTEGKAQLADLIMALRDKLDDPFNAAYAVKLWKGTESPEATCIAYLDLIRKV